MMKVDDIKQEQKNAVILKWFFIIVFFCLFLPGCGPLYVAVTNGLYLLHLYCCCIVEGEQITTPTGTIPVEELSVGDKVISVCASGEQVIGRVVAKHTASSDSYIELILDGQEESLRVTSAHPIATPSCWKRAGDLTVGEWVQTQNGLKRVGTVSYRAGPVKVYNITVSPYSNFLAEGILVHNKSIAPPRTICTDDEIIWFDVSDSFLVTCRANGTISLWETSTGKPISHFMIDNSQLFCFNPSLFVSPDGRPVFADIQTKYIPPDNSECYFVVSFYDLETGRKTKTARVDDITELTGLGFSENAKEFFCIGRHYDFVSGNEIPLLNEVVLCISVETGKIVWRSEYDAQLGPPTIQAVPSRDSYVTFDTGLITARDKQGKILWEKTVNGRPINIHPLVGPVKTFCAVPTKRKKIFAISLLDGKKLWEKNGVSGDSLLAVTHDGKRQAFYIDRFLFDDFLLVTSLPNKETKTFKGIKTKCDAVFTKDGKKLLCLPRLKKVAEDRKAYTRTYARRSNLMKVVDCETGEVIGFDLRKP